MPKGKFLNHKGRHRKFTNPEELEEQRKQEEEERRRKNLKGDKESGGSDDDGSAKGSGSDSEDESSDDEPGRPKGVSGLIQVKNPNRVVKKNVKLNDLNEAIEEGEEPSLSRREKEEVQKQQRAANYWKLHAAGKTDKAKSDLARLALVRQQREEAAKRRELEKQSKEAKSKSGNV